MGDFEYGPVGIGNQLCSARHLPGRARAWRADEKKTASFRSRLT